jgi:acyl transferase domain-containing protein
MYKDGVRLFLEVGPNNVLTGLIDQILEGKSYKAIAVEGQGGGVKGILSAVGAVFADGYNLNIESLFEGRNCEFLNLSEAIKESKKKTHSDATVLLHGGGVRKIDENIAITGISPLIDATKRKEIKSVEVLKLSLASGQLNTNDQLLAGYQSYQQTMQQFLASQETMMELFLKGEPILDQQINNTDIPLAAVKMDQIPLINEEIDSNEIEGAKTQFIENDKIKSQETLAIIVYHQPVTRSDIEEIRGVAFGTNTIETLLELDWVRPAGRKDVPGKPIQYSTTENFLNHFNIQKLKLLNGFIGHL